MPTNINIKPRLTKRQRTVRAALDLGIWIALAFLGLVVLLLATH